MCTIGCVVMIIVGLQNVAAVRYQFLSAEEIMEMSIQSKVYISIPSYHVQGIVDSLVFGIAEGNKCWFATHTSRCNVELESSGLVLNAFVDGQSGSQEGVSVVCDRVVCLCERNNN